MGRKVLFFLLALSITSVKSQTKQHSRIILTSDDVIDGIILTPKSRDYFDVVSGRDTIKVMRSDIKVIQLSDGSILRFDSLTGKPIFYKSDAKVEPEILTIKKANRKENTWFMAYCPIISRGFIGASLGYITNDQLGIYFGVAIGRDLTEADNYYDKISRYLADEIFEDQFNRERTSTSSYQIGLTIKVLNGFYLFGAIDKINHAGFREYYDRTHILGTDGNYIIKDSSKDESMKGYLFGAMIKTSNEFYIQLGITTEEQSFMLGFGVML